MIVLYPFTTYLLSVVSILLGVALFSNRLEKNKEIQEYTIKEKHKHRHNLTRNDIHEIKEKIKKNK